MQKMELNGEFVLVQKMFEMHAYFFHNTLFSDLRAICSLRQPLGVGTGHAAVALNSHSPQLPSASRRFSLLRFYLSYFCEVIETAADGFICV